MSENTETPPDLESVFLENAFYVTSNLRVVASQAMKNQLLDGKTDETTKRLLFLSIHQQLCMAFEDLGSIMLASREKRKGKEFLAVLTNYKGKSADLSELIRGMADETIAETYAFGAPVPALYQKLDYSSEELQRSAANFTNYVKSLAGMQIDRGRICNKLKHAGTALYLPGSPNVISILDWDKDKKNVQSEGLPYKTSELRTFLYAIAACSAVYKDIAFWQLAHCYSEVAEKLLHEPAFQESHERTNKLIYAELDEMKRLNGVRRYRHSVGVQIPPSAPSTRRSFRFSRLATLASKKPTWCQHFS